MSQKYKRLFVIVADDSVHDGAHDADDDAAEERGAEIRNGDAAAEDAASQPCGELEHERVHDEVEDAEREY